MAVYKRGGVYWYEFEFKNLRIRRSTKVTSAREARQIEAAHRAALAKGEAGIATPKQAPTLREFAKDFLEFVDIRNAEKPATVVFYRYHTRQLLAFEPLATARLDAINPVLIDDYVRRRRRNARIATTNRDLATLRRMLNVAEEWGVLERAPKVRLLPGEKPREFVLGPDTEEAYLEHAGEDLRTLAILMIETGMRPSEVLKLAWADVQLDPVGQARYGYASIRREHAKSGRPRSVPLTPRATELLQQMPRRGPLVMGNPPKKLTSFDREHRRLCRFLDLPEEFVLHSLRHTALTRLGEAGVDAFSIMRFAGHESVTTSQRYVHPVTEAMERALDRLEEVRKLRAAAGGSLQEVPTKVPTVRGDRER